ncbi:hypothetical protein [Shewanella surugensis]|uniref:Intracellular septation protein A n=1 Tax=Shewanella surugensis TaxID=212020 RepID=A0ABT0L6D0_9GAMM|nr:hypothetical protein [Shewanella surugensis]MCL1123239.1 hypothetical protein [Shewanella surugensis]
MNESNQSHLLRYLTSRNALETILFPIVIYSLLFWSLGAGWAVIGTAAYGVCVALIREENSSISVVLLLLFSGGFHYAFSKGFTPLGISEESVFLSVTSALTTIVVFSVYSIINRPIIRVLAESGMPQLKSLPIHGTRLYNRVWHEVSLVWIIATIFKLLAVLVCYKEGLNSMDFLVFLFSWPYTLALIAFSVKWPKKRWQHDV